MISGNVSHYRILEKLGAGSMGEVYLAEDTRLARKVALKFLPASYQYDPERRSRFLREARAASALRSPGIAAVFDIGEHEGSQFIAMEYVEGELLSRRIERGPLGVRDSIDVALQVAQALDEAHSLGIVHRDIKSSNLMLTERGLVKVLDFGLAKLAEQPDAEAEDGDRTLIFGKETSPGVVLGTACYMSPEQARGLAVDQRTDLFSLGVVLYEMLTGKRPFEGATTSDLIVSILEREPPPLSRHSAAMPAHLDWIVAKALRKERDERYQSAKDLAVDLKNLKQSLEFEAALGRTAMLAPSSGALSSDRTTAESARQDTSSSLAAGSRRRRSRKAIDSLAILPLVNASADPGAEYLSDGITESIINSLSRLPKLRVMARSTVFRYKGREIDAQATGAQLGVRAVVTGRVNQVGDRLIIGAELVDVEDGSQLWGEQYNRKLADILAIQEDISREISDSLRLKLGGKEKKRLAKRLTDNTEAYELYLKGRYHFNKWIEEGFRKSIEYFEQAVEKDPNFALAYSGLSDAYGALWYFNFVAPDEAIPQARAAAHRALEIDDTLAEAHLSLGDAKLYYEWDWEGAERELKRAIELNPSYAPAHQMYAVYLLVMDQHDEAVREMSRSRELDPLSIIAASGMGMIFYFTRNYDEAINRYHKALELDPTFPLAHEGLGAAYERKGMYEEAVAEYLKMMPHWSRSLEAIPAMEEAFRQSGMNGFWRKWIEFAGQLTRRFVSPYLIGCVYATLGDKDRAFEWLEKAYEERTGNLVHLKVDPRLDAIRSDSRFDDLLRRMGLL